MRFDAVLFDLDDTLHDDTLAYRTAARKTAAGAARERGLDEDALYAAYVDRAETFWRDLSAATLQIDLAGLRAAMWTGALATCGVDDAPYGARLGAEYNRNRDETLVLWPGVRDMLGRLRERGLKIGIVTNGLRETHREKIRRLGLADAVDGIFIADEIGAVKPDPRFFFIAAETMRVEPARCAVVGDRYDRDVLGAQRAGMFSILLLVRPDSTPPGSRPADAVVSTILEVEAIVTAART